MKPDMKVKRALIDTPGVKEHPQGKFNYTPEFLEKLSKDFREQVVELDIHDSGRIGDVLKLGYCPTHGLYADLLVPADTPEDDAKFSTDIKFTATSEGEDGVLNLEDGYLNKVVWATPDGPPVRNVNTRLCNTAEPGDEPMPEDSKVEDLNQEIGSLQAQISAKEEELQSEKTAKSTLEQEKAELEQRLADKEKELEPYIQAIEKQKEELVSKLARDNELKQKAYSTLSLEELQALKEEEQVPDTPVKGVKARGAMVRGNPPSDDKFTFNKYLEMKKKYGVS